MSKKNGKRIRIQKLQRIVKLAKAVIDSSDSTGCTSDLTVISQDALNQLQEFIVNNCGDLK